MKVKVKVNKNGRFSFLFFHALLIVNCPLSSTVYLLKYSFIESEEKAIQNIFPSKIKIDQIVTSTNL